MRGRPSRFRVFLSFALVVILPTAFVAWFLLTQASERFSTEFRIAVRSLDMPRSTGVEGLLSVAGIGTPVSSESHALVQFLESRSIIENLEAENAITFDGVFSRDGLDLLSAIEPGSPIEAQVTHWKRFVDARFEPTSNTVIVAVTAFHPEDTARLSDALLAEADKFVNVLSESARQDAAAFARSEVADAEQRMLQARIAIAEFQEREQMIDPRETAASQQGVAAALREELAFQRTILDRQRQSLGDDTVVVQRTLSRIESIEAEIRRLGEESTVGTEAGDSQTLSQKILEFSRLESEMEFAAQAYQSALVSLEAARVEADRQQLFLATIVPPGLPERASFPKPVQGTLIAAGLLGTVWLIGLIAYFAVREHV